MQVMSPFTKPYVTSRQRRQSQTNPRLCLGGNPLRRARYKQSDSPPAFPAIRSPAERMNNPWKRVRTQGREVDEKKKKE